MNTEQTAQQEQQPGQSMVSMNDGPLDTTTEKLAEVGQWGRDDLMAVAAVRYCLGRQSYIVGDCVDWLIRWWPAIGESCRNIIARDVNEAFVNDDDSRERGDKYRPLGMDIDRNQWERARALWQIPNAE